MKLILYLWIIRVNEFLLISIISMFHFTLFLQSEETFACTISSMISKTLQFVNFNILNNQRNVVFMLNDFYTLKIKPFARLMTFFSL